MNRKVHRTPDGLQQIVNLRASINQGLSETQKAAFPNTEPVSRPVIMATEILNPNWLAGFVDGEGCFYVRLSQRQIQLDFSISQSDRDLGLLNYIVSYLNSGAVRTNSRNSVASFSVTKFSDIIEKLIPFFDTYPLQGSKLSDYLCFRQVAMLMKDKVHLTKEGADQIRVIKESMNKGGTRL